jgi:hypothetical protein
MLEKLFDQINVGDDRSIKVPVVERPQDGLLFHRG